MAEHEDLKRKRVINSFIHNFVRSVRKANFNALTQDQIKFAANPEQVMTLFSFPLKEDGT